MVVDKHSGFIYKFDDIDDLANKMKILFSNKKLAQEYGENARRDALIEYDSEKYYDEIIRLYETKEKDGKKAK